MIQSITAPTDTDPANMQFGYLFILIVVVIGIVSYVERRRKRGGK